MAWQSGQDLSRWTPEELATRLGTYAGQVGYESNDPGSFERNYNQLLSSLTPDMLLKRYSTLNSGFGTEVDRVQAQAYREAKQALGRDITPDEYAQIMPYFMGPNGLAQGRAFLSQIKQREENDPTNIRSPYNPQNPNNRLGQYNQPVNNVFQELLKRGASQAELDHFRQLLATGQADEFTLRNFISQLPEYRQQQDTQFRQGLNEELAGYDTKEFDRQKQSIISQYAANGQYAGNSPSLDYALTDLMGRLAEQRGKFLAGLSSEQYQGNKEAARGDYQSLLDRMYGLQDEKRQRAYGQQDYLTGRRDELQDYQRQQQDYINFVNSQRRNNRLTTGDWINLGLGAGNTAARFYQGYQSNPYNFLNS